MFIAQMAFGWFIFVIVSQQLILVNSTWSVKLVEHEQANREYTQLMCNQMKTTNTQFINECERLSIVMRISPLNAAVTDVINKWNSCLMMPCTQLAHTISSHYEYMLLFLLVSLGFAYYAHLLFNMTLDKSIEFQDRLRARDTLKYKTGR